MPQDSGKVLPSSINTDIAYEEMQPNEAPFIKGLSIDINGNPNSEEGTNNPIGEGQNVLVLTPTRSNEPIPNVILPDGYNLTSDAFYSSTTQEMYVFNYNGDGNHGIYVLDGNSGVWSTIIIDPKLSFSNDLANAISEHRVRLRVRYNDKKQIVEKHLTWTDGNVWQGWVNVIAAVSTNGFDAGVFPYWTLLPPHFDREELFQYPVRPPMYNPIAVAIPNTESDKGKVNYQLNTGFQFAFQFVNTDGRQSVISPYSAPLIIKSTEFLSNPDLLPKNSEVTLYAGSCLVESVNLYYRKTVYKKGEYGSDLASWSDWYLYDTINKFTSCGDNDPAIIGNSYWLRKNPWEGLSYDPVKNTFKYKFDNSKVGQITPQELFQRYQDMPQLSVALTDLGDAIGLANNRTGFDNFNCGITDKIKLSVEQSEVAGCTVPFRKVRMYVYVGRERGGDSTDTSTRLRNIWVSQVGFTDGADKTVRFGGTYFTLPTAKINIDETKQFELNFADKESFRLYLKGTPYYADAKWHFVAPDFTLTKIETILDRQSVSDIQFLTSVYAGQGFFVGVFDLEVPAGRYIAALGRHNVESAGDYRNQSTYVLGIANSRLASPVAYSAQTNPAIPGGVPVPVVITTVRPNAIVSNYKEIDIDCTGGDVDLWGNGYDMFYVACPFSGLAAGASRWTFIEGYLQESAQSKLGVENFLYGLTYVQGGVTGLITDKNGFFWGYTWGDNTNNNSSNIFFNAVMDCTLRHFVIPINNGASNSQWRHNNTISAADYNGGTFGFANRVLLKGRITDITGAIGYSNIAVSIENGNTAVSDQNGNFTLIIHNGTTQPRRSNVYVNSAGSFLISLSNCGFIPLFYYDDSTVPCQNTSERRHADLNQSVLAQSGEYQSLKSTAAYLTGVIGADLAGRVTAVNKLNQLSVKSFPAQNAVFPTHFKWAISDALALNQSAATTDIKWLGFCTILASNYKKYVQWIGDKIEFIDASGNVTTSPSTAALVRITISSLLEANIQKNFTLLSNYQFLENDRLRIFDDGDNNLFDTAIYGDIIDVQVQGSNYNQAAVNANLIPPATNIVLNADATSGSNPTTIYASYDSRFDKLKDKTGFWIELYSPSENNDKLPFYEIKWYPVVNGEIAEFISGNEQAPVYNYPVSDDLNYWDTYFLRRSINIPNVGNKFIQHIFESPNITDTWGAKVSSGGRVNAINPFARRLWYRDSIIRSDSFISEGVLNGLATFRKENTKEFKGYQRGGIVAIICQYSVIFFLCENDFFVTDFNYNFIYANAQGVQVANLDNNLGEPHQKIGSNSGVAYEDTKTVKHFDKSVAWYDRKGESLMVSNYSSAEDVSDLTDKDGRKYGIKSYLIKKTQFINKWNAQSGIESIFEVSLGLDLTHKNIYLTFRPRRQNTNLISSYVNKIRNIDLRQQETAVFNYEKGRWSKFEAFAPEAYGMICGNSSGMEMISFAAGKPYKHNNTTGNSFMNFFGVQCESVLMSVLNKKPNDVKILQSFLQDTIGQNMYVDLMYTNQNNSFSYIPQNMWKDKEKIAYAAALRDMVTYLDPNNANDFRSTLQDGKRIFGEYVVVRFVGDYTKLSEYFELSGIEYLFTNSTPTKP